MRTFRFRGREFGFEFDFRHWRLGREHWADSAFGERLYWLGPLHVAMATTPR